MKASCCKTCQEIPHLISTTTQASVLNSRVIYPAAQLHPTIMQSSSPHKRPTMKSTYHFGEIVDKHTNHSFELPARSCINIAHVLGCVIAGECGCRNYPQCPGGFSFIFNMQTKATTNASFAGKTLIASEHIRWARAFCLSGLVVGI